MAKVQFFTQKMIDGWVAESKVEFDGVTLTVKGEPVRRYALKPATMFLSMVEGEDRHKILGKVLTEDHLKTLKADAYLDSVLIGEIAYKVEPGFVVHLPAESAKPAKAADPQDLSLADLMLKTLDQS